MSELISAEVTYSDIKLSFPRKPSLKVLAVLSIRSGQLQSGSEGFPSCSLQCFCLASSPCCSIASLPWLRKQHLSNSSTQSSPGLWPCHFPPLLWADSAKSEVKAHSASPLQHHKYKIHGRKSINYICAYLGALMSCKASRAPQKLPHPTPPPQFVIHVLSDIWLQNKRVTHPPLNLTEQNKVPLSLSGHARNLNYSLKAWPCCPIELYRRILLTPEEFYPALDKIIDLLFFKMSGY